MSGPLPDGDVLDGRGRGKSGGSNALRPLHLADAKLIHPPPAFRQQGCPGAGPKAGLIAKLLRRAHHRQRAGDLGGGRGCEHVGLHRIAMEENMHFALCRVNAKCIGGALLRFAVSNQVWICQGSIIALALEGTVRFDQIDILVGFSQALGGLMVAAGLGLSVAEFMMAGPKDSYNLWPWLSLAFSGLVLVIYSTGVLAQIVTARAAQDSLVELQAIKASLKLDRAA